MRPSLCMVMLALFLVVWECGAAAEDKDQGSGVGKTGEAGSTPGEGITDSGDNAVKPTVSVSEVEQTPTTCVATKAGSGCYPNESNARGVAATPKTCNAEKPAEVQLSDSPKSECKTSSEVPVGKGDGDIPTPLLSSKEHSAAISNEAGTERQPTHSKGPDVQPEEEIKSNPQSENENLTAPKGGVHTLSDDTLDTVSGPSSPGSIGHHNTGPQGSTLNSDSTEEIEIRRNAAPGTGGTPHSDSSPNVDRNTMQQSAGVPNHTKSNAHTTDLLKSKFNMKTGHGKNSLSEDQDTIGETFHTNTIRGNTLKSKKPSDKKPLTDIQDNTEITSDSTKPEVASTSANSNDGTTKTLDEPTDAAPPLNHNTHSTEPMRHLPFISNALPLHQSVEKTDGILCSSSLFALAALATLAVAAAAPAH